MACLGLDSSPVDTCRIGFGLCFRGDRDCLFLLVLGEGLLLRLCPDEWVGDDMIVLDLDGARTTSLLLRSRRARTGSFMSSFRRYVKND